MLDQIKRETVWKSSDDSIAGSKISVLAVIEVIFSVIAYWWIAATYETHLHILTSLIAAPLLFLRSEKSVASAKVSWTKFKNQANSRLETTLRPPFAIAVVFISACLSFMICRYIITMFLTNPNLQAVEKFESIFPFGVNGYTYFGYLTIFLFLTICVNNISFFVIDSALGATIGYPLRSKQRKNIHFLAAIGSAMSIFIVTNKTLTLYSSLLDSTLISFAISVFSLLTTQILYPPYGLIFGIWLRIFKIRALSVLSNPLAGLENTTTNWRNTLLTEDLYTKVSPIPGINTESEISNSTIINFKANNSDSIDLFLFNRATNRLTKATAHLWRLSLKSTCWFYAPILLVSRAGELSNAETRRLHFDAKPSLWFTWRFLFAVIGLLAVAFATINWATAWQFHHSDAPFSPVGWLLVLDWNKFTEQPWQWFSLPAAALTVVIYFWLDSLRKLRDSAKSAGKDPERIVSIEHHPGQTIYWLDRIRNALAIISLIVGLWHFTKWAYFNGTIRALEPYLLGVFGAR